MSKWILSSDIEEWEKVDHEIEYELTVKGYSSKFIASIMLAMDEAFANISMYAYSNERGIVIIESSYEVKDNCRYAKISFIDYGIEFNPLEKETNPNIQETTASKRKIGGLGIFLIKKSVDEIRYTYSNCANKLEFIKKENI